MGQVTIHPLEDWDSMDTFSWPDPDDPKFYEGMEERLEGNEDKYVQNHIFMCFFERMHSLRGFENTLADLYLEPEKSEELADRIVDFHIRVVENVWKRFERRVDGFAFSDDWGTETGLFINPEIKDIIYLWGTENGGVIYAYDDSNNEALDIPQCNMDYMNEAFEKYDRWKNDRQ